MNTISSRIIYQNRQQIGPDPRLSYVYLWRHDGVARYIGKSNNDLKRWLAHLDINPNDSNQQKYRYFRDHLACTSAAFICEILDEGISEEASAMLEHTEQKRHRLITDDGTLLNHKYAEIIPVQRTPRSLGQHQYKDRLWHLLLAATITPNALFARNIPHDNRNKNSPGYRYFTDFYPPFGSWINFADMLRKGAAAGFEVTAQIGHSTWDFIKNKAAFKLPDGEDVEPGHILPTLALLGQYARQLEQQGIGTPHEWSRYCSRYWGVAA
jgi:hypothetical protein